MAAVGATEWALGVACARRVVVERVLKTDGAVLAFGRRDGQSVVLKLAKPQGDEWRAGAVLSAFDGRGAVRVYEHDEGVTLMERSGPGHSLVGMAVDGRDDEATAILAATIAAMTPGAPFNGFPTAEDWARGFDRYDFSGDTQIPSALCCKARRLYLDLCRSQRSVRPTCTTTMCCSTSIGDGLPSIPRVSSASWNSKSAPR